MSTASPRTCRAPRHGSVFANRLVRLLLCCESRSSSDGHEFHDDLNPMVGSFRVGARSYRCASTNRAPNSLCAFTAAPLMEDVLENRQDLIISLRTWPSSTMSPLLFDPSTVAVVVGVVEAVADSKRSIAVRAKETNRQSVYRWHNPMQNDEITSTEE